MCGLNDIMYIMPPEECVILLLYIVDKSFHSSWPYYPHPHSHVGRVGVGLGWRDMLIPIFLEDTDKVKKPGDFDIVTKTEHE